MYAPLFVALRDFFQQAVWNGKRVPVVFAGPDRAHAEMTRVAQRRLRGERTRQQTEDSPIPVPFMSLWIDPPKYAPTWNTPATIRGVTKVIATGNATKMRMPRPVEATVQVDLWCSPEGGHSIAQSVEPQIELRFTTGDMVGP